MRSKTHMELMRRVSVHCKDIDGEQVRGVVTAIPCPTCRSRRFDDGTPCEVCGAYAKVRIAPKLNELCMLHHRVEGYSRPRATRYVFGFPICDDTACAATAMRERGGKAVQ